MKEEKLQTVVISAEEFRQYTIDALESLIEIVNMLDGENREKAQAILNKRGLSALVGSPRK